MAQIDDFWVVTLPKTVDATMRDICFLSTPSAIGLQFKGGLECGEILGFYTDRESATEAAKGLLCSWCKADCQEKCGIDV